MIRLQQAVIVEGKYDKIKLENIVDALILPTYGFEIFKDKTRMNLIRRLAKTRGIILLTDSDSAGFMIRSHIAGSVQEGKVYHAYIPDLYGKERRKTSPSKEGKLGVEGVPEQVLLEALAQAGVLPEEGAPPSAAEQRQITRTDLYEDGLSGGADSRRKRQALLAALDLPERLSTGALLDVLNRILDYSEYKRLIAELEKKNEF